MTSGRRRAERPGRSARRVLWWVAAVVALAAWSGLVILAVREGRTARDGGSAGQWAVAALEVLAAIAVLLVAFRLFGQALAGSAGRAQRRPPGRHRTGAQ